MVEITTTLENNNIETSAFALYPNPTNGMVTIESKQVIKQATVRNVLGQTVKVFELKSGEKTFDISSLKSGNYFVTLENEAGRTFTKMIVKK